MLNFLLHQINISNYRAIQLRKSNEQINDCFCVELDIQQEISCYGVEKKLNDYIGVQKEIIPQLEKENFFGNIVNEESGMVIEITRKGIKETLGSGKRFQNLPRILKELKIATLSLLPDMIRLAHLVQDNVRNMHGKAAEYAYFIVKVKINGIVFDVKIDVQKTSAKNKFWLHMVEITEKNSQLLSPNRN